MAQHQRPQPRQEWTRWDKISDVGGKITLWVFFIGPLILLGIAATWALYLGPMLRGSYG